MPKARSLDDLLDDWTSKDKRVKVLTERISAINYEKWTIEQSREYAALIAHKEKMLLLSSPAALRLFFTLAGQSLSLEQLRKRVDISGNLPDPKECLQPYINFGFVRVRDGKYKLTDLGRAYLNYLQTH